MIEEAILAQCCSRCENSQNAIVMHNMNSHDSWWFLHEFTKTVVDLGSWSTNQKESLNLVENWESLDQEKFDEDSWALEKNGGKNSYALRIVIIINISVMIMILYFTLITSLITN